MRESAMWVRAARNAHLFAVGKPYDGSRFLCPNKDAWRASDPDRVRANVRLQLVAPVPYPGQSLAWFASDEHRILTALLLAAMARDEEGRGNPPKSRRPPV